MVTRRQFLQGATSLALLGGRLGAFAGDPAATAAEGAATPNEHFGAAPADRPPSFGNAAG
jgi:hypothetical protein